MPLKGYYMNCMQENKYFLLNDIDFRCSKT